MPFLKKRPWIAMALVVACICMWGCGLFDEDVTHEVHEKRHSGLVIAILDDSLALETNGRGWTDHTESCDYWENCDGGTINQGLFLVNYRNKQRPLWGDTIDGVITIIWGLAADSTVLFYDKKNNFGFWKVGKLPDVRKKIKIEDGCAWNDPYTRAKPWINGKILLKDMYPCAFAVLDTVSGIVKKLEFTGEYAWLDGCDDITYIDGDVVCVKRLGEPTGAITLFSKGDVVDSLVYDHYTGNSPVFWGEYVAAYIYKKDSVEGDLIAKFSKNGFDRNYPKIWKKYNSFVDSAGSSISYSSEDLIVTK
ncbi:MAG: hypothetical protein J5615_06770 [Fibrobacter sp.]|nr:hypothetical protein [Fibrobacter sp.]